MYTVVSTRFTDETWEQNLEYRKKNSSRGCIYGSPQEMSPKILYDSIVFVVEMNNDINEIKGIGLVKNRPFLDKYYQIYKDGNYNRFIYKSDYYLDRDVLIRFNKVLVDILEYVLFKEKSHLKRGSGFTTITQTLLSSKKHEKCKKLDIVKITQVIRGCFTEMFTETSTCT